MSAEYLFHSLRLGFRGWANADLDSLAALNADPAVMAYFSATKSREETRQFMARMRQHQREHGFCYFAVDRLDKGSLIGFIGLCWQKYDEVSPDPFVDIGWRLRRAEWGRGYATEGARRCLEFAFAECALREVKAVCPVVNTRSERVMQKIGMQWERNFIHPALAEDLRLQECLMYEIDPKLFGATAVPGLI